MTSQPVALSGPPICALADTPVRMGGVWWRYLSREIMLTSTA
jgi:hypothetical protein